MALSLRDGLKIWEEKQKTSKKEIIGNFINTKFKIHSKFKMD